MFVKPLLLAAFLVAGPIGLAAPLRAETAPLAADQAQVQALSDTMMMGPLFELLLDEGRAYGQALEDDMFPGRGGALWPATVEAIYEPARLRAQFDASLTASLDGDPAALAEMQAFFGSELGQKILTLELEARRVLLDTAAEDAAAVAAEKLMAARDPRIKLIRKLVETNDLLEMNVAGALSGNLAFFQGLASEGIGAEMSAEDQMAEIWGQEVQIRSDTDAWLMPYLVLAYKPLTDADLQAYIDFSATPAGQRLNGALFAAFDDVFRKVSYDLGKAAAKTVLGSDI